MKYHIFIIASALTLAGCGNKSDSGSDNGNATQNATATPAVPDITLPHLSLQPSDARTYLDKAAAGDDFEIESSRAILKTSKNPNIRAFADQMITAHQASSSKLRAAAAKLHLAAGSTSLSPDQQHKLDGIRSASAVEADQLYITSQHSAHADALDLHRHYASDGDTAPLKEVAAAIVPVVQKHMNDLDKLANAQDGG